MLSVKYPAIFITSPFHNFLFISYICITHPEYGWVIVKFMKRTLCLLVTS